MTPAKLNVLVAYFPYGGNGGTSSEVPSIREWSVATALAATKDERIDHIGSVNLSDTPITMTRNKAVLEARKQEADVLVMVDSDMHPDLYLGQDYGAKPFWASSFDFLYKRRMEGKATVVGAPYCGPPKNEVCYVFKWTGRESHHASPDIELNMYPREEAALMEGIQPCAALPTGLIMFDMEVFEATDPKHQMKRLRESGMDSKTAHALVRPWFYYEWTSMYQAEKGSTEDVTCTRDMGLVCQELLGYNPLFCNWDAWAGHYKPKCVGKPTIITADRVNEQYRSAVLRGRSSEEKMVYVTRNGLLPANARK